MKIFFLSIIIALASNLPTKQMGIQYDYDIGLNLAKKENKKVVPFFTGRHCKYPLELNQILADPALVKKIQDRFVPIVLFVDDPSPLDPRKKGEIDGKQKILRDRGAQWAHIELSLFQENIQPLVGIVDYTGRVLKDPIKGKMSKSRILDYIKD